MFELMLYRMLQRRRMASSPGVEALVDVVVPDTTDIVSITGVVDDVIIIQGCRMNKGKRKRKL